MLRQPLGGVVFFFFDELPSKNYRVPKCDVTLPRHPNFLLFINKTIFPIFLLAFKEKKLQLTYKIFAS